MGITDRFKNAWNAFFNNRDPTPFQFNDYGSVYWDRPDRPRFTRGNERTIVTAIYNRIAIDAAAIKFQHVRLDENGRFKEVIESGLNNCLTMDANADQTGRAFMQDIVMSMLDEGCIAVVPIDTSINPMKSGSYDILTMRVGKITEWHPEYVKTEVYNERSGKKETISVLKKNCAIIENPFYSVINEPNSVLKRLLRKLVLLDQIDEQSGAGKLDLIIQLPYVVKTETRQKQAENRRLAIEQQLSNSKYGIAYTDATEHVTQLNRPLENNLMGQIEYLTKMLYSQLGLTDDIMNGTANEQVMLNYYNRTIEPILSAIADEMNRKFLTKTARSQKQAIAFYNDPFKLTPVGELSEIADKFTRNEIMTSNEIRQVIGMKPVDDPNADMLRNKNLYPTDDLMGEIPEELLDEMPEDTAPEEEATAPNQNRIEITVDTPISQLPKPDE